MEVDSRELSIVQIHVEHIVGVLKQKFTFYETLYQYQIIVTATLSTIDKIVCVCCALVNLYPTIVPQYYVSNSTAFVFYSSLNSHQKDSTFFLLGCFFFISIHSETIVAYIHHDH